VCWLQITRQILTRVGALLLLPEIASQLNTLVVGEDHTTVMTFDLALCEKAVQFLDARSDSKRVVVPRLGELHAVIISLRALGVYIETRALMMRGLKVMNMGYKFSGVAMKKSLVRKPLPRFFLHFNVLLKKHFVAFLHQ
jgi:hypothetical protein